MRKTAMGLPALLLVFGTAAADGDRDSGDFGQHGSRKPDERAFERIATLPNYVNNAEAGEQTVSEIIASTADGKTLVYTDALLEVVGFIDITKPRLPISAGTLELGGSPTSVAVLGNKLALVGVDTTAGDFTAPSGYLAVVDIKTRRVLREIALGGQPDSVKLSPDGRFVAIAIENQRDEEIEVAGVEGGLPQLPAGFLAIVDILGSNPSSWQLRTVALTGLAKYAPEDPEPEFVDVNDRNEAVVTLQENNHVAIVDLRSGKVVDHFPAGAVTLRNVDTEEDGIIDLSETVSGIAREPDAVAWVGGGKNALIATANEGDLFGGSRGFTIFDRRGRVVFDSGNSLEALAVRHGHYPEARSDAKGTEPEAIEYAKFGHDEFLFVGSERGSFVAVYRLRGDGRPAFVQLLPAPLGPEGLHAIPARDLLVVSGEEDDPEFGVRSTVMIYKLRGGEPSYPQIVSADDRSRKPIAWSALSGLVSVPGKRDTLLGVWDSFYAESRIFTIDVSEKPAVITGALTIRGGRGGYDPEGIAIAPDGTYWLASEGNASGSVPNLLIQVDKHGNVLREVGLPAEIEACRAASANRGTLGSGYEGVAVSKTAKGYVLLVAQQRGWDYTASAGATDCEALDDDVAGTNPGEPRHTRIWIFDPKNAQKPWEHFLYELEPLPPNATWVGLSEITAVPGGYIVIERDNRTGDFGELKTLVKFDLRATLDGVVTRAEKDSYDLLPDLLATNGWITDKPEGVAVTSDGRTYVVTDNDGVDDWSGETWFLRLGQWSRLFR